MAYRPRRDGLSPGAVTFKPFPPGVRAQRLIDGANGLLNGERGNIGSSPCAACRQSIGSQPLRYRTRCGTSVLCSSAHLSPLARPVFSGANVNRSRVAEFSRIFGVVGASVVAPETVSGACTTNPTHHRREESVPFHRGYIRAYSIIVHSKVGPRTYM